MDSRDISDARYDDVGIINWICKPGLYFVKRWSGQKQTQTGYMEIEFSNISVDCYSLRDKIKYSVFFFMLQLKLVAPFNDL